MSEHVTKLENMLIGDAQMASMLERFVRNGCTSEQRRLALAQIEFIDHRIEQVQRELRRVRSGAEPRFNVAEAEKFMPMFTANPETAVRPLGKIKFYGIEQVAV